MSAAARGRNGLVITVPPLSEIRFLRKISMGEDRDAVVWIIEI
jgi:hypothetical protein